MLFIILGGICGFLLGAIHVVVMYHVRMSGKNTNWPEQDNLYSGIPQQATIVDSENPLDINLGDDEI